MLRRTGNMMRDTQSFWGLRRLRRGELREIPHLRGKGLGARLPFRIVSEKMRIVDQMGCTSCGRNKDGFRIAGTLESRDGLLRPGSGLVATTQMMSQRSAAARAAQRGYCHAAAGQHALCGRIDGWSERLLHATRHLCN